MKKSVIILLSVLLLMAIAVSAETEIYFFHGQGCPHCASMDAYLSELEGQYDIDVKKFEVYYNQANRQLFSEMSAAYGKKVGGVPTLFLDNTMVVGFSPAVQTQLRAKLDDCSSRTCVSPEDYMKHSPVAVQIPVGTEESKNGSKDKAMLTISAVLGAALVDAINPCAFAVLIILMTTILASGNKRRALFSGLAFSLSVFISYFLMGLGLYSAISAAGVSRVFYAIVAVFAIIIGLFNLKDWLWYGKWFVMEVPLSWRPRLKSLIRGVTSVPGAFLIGFAVSLFLLPCTSGPYIVILGLLANTATFNYAVGLLLLYNIVFVMPMMVITIFVAAGLMTTKKAEKWRQKKLKDLHLIAGAILLLLGIFMLAALAAAYI